MISKIKEKVDFIVRCKLIPYLLKFKVLIKFPLSRKGLQHSLESKLIVSLTSYPPRFEKLPLTLKCLLMQSIAPDAVILWIAKEDEVHLTSEILNLKKHGLQIMFCQDLKSYKKIIPALSIYPDSFIVTADDDIYYWKNWLKELVDTYRVESKYVVCHRARKISVLTNGKPDLYQYWIVQDNVNEISYLNFQTGVGGVLYPPYSLHLDVGKYDLFNSLCPNADDIWLYWMTRLAGNLIKCVPENNGIYLWPNNQENGLFHFNVINGGNDKQISTMVDFYGFLK